MTTIDDTLPSSSSGPLAAAGTMPYEVEESLGHGGMGDVLLAKDPKFGRRVALKRMRATAPPPEAVERFVREAKIQALLDHPAIVPVHDLGYDAEGRPYFTMKRLAGKTMAALLETGAATQQRLLRAVVDVCHAVDLAHARAIVHRDLKPANIMLGDYGEVYVLDWGVARVLDEADIPSLGPGASGEHEAAAPHTQVGALLGTPGYMAPEQVRGEDVGRPADVYALGSVLFEVLAGRALHPRGSGALASTLDPEVDRSPASRAGGSRAVAPELDAICTHALAEDAADRPTVRELGDAIQQYLDGDRDLEHRCTLAVEHVAAARAALASGDRAGAVHHAGRAIALDPNSTEASDFLAQLFVEPPKPWPPELAALVAAAEEHGARDRSKRAVLPFLLFPVAMAPAIPFLDVTSWPTLVALLVCGLSLGVMSYVNWRIRRMPIVAFFCVQLAFIVLLTRLASPFVLAPMVIAGVILAQTAVPWAADRRWAVAAWALLASSLPLVLEHFGILASTWSMSEQGLVSHGSLARPHAWPDAALYVGGNVAITLVLAMYAFGFARDRRSAQRATHVHAWQLQQLLPRRPR